MHMRRLASNSRRSDCLSVYTGITHSLSGLLISNSQLLAPNLLFVVQSLSRVQLFATPWTAAHQASLSFTVFQSLLSLFVVQLLSLAQSSVVQLLSVGLFVTHVL